MCLLQYIQQIRAFWAEDEGEDGLGVPVVHAVDPCPPVEAVRVLHTDNMKPVYILITHLI